MYKKPVNLSVLFIKSDNGRSGCNLCERSRWFKTAKGLAVHLHLIHNIELNEDEMKWIYKTSRSLERARK